MEYKSKLLLITKDESHKIRPVFSKTGISNRYETVIEYEDKYYGLFVEFDNLENTYIAFLSKKIGNDPIWEGRIIHDIKFHIYIV